MTKRLAFPLAGLLLAFSLMAADETPKKEAPASSPAVVKAAASVDSTSSHDSPLVRASKKSGKKKARIEITNETLRKVSEDKINVTTSTSTYSPTLQPETPPEHVDPYILNFKTMQEENKRKKHEAIEKEIREKETMLIDESFDTSTMDHDSIEKRIKELHEQLNQMDAPPAAAAPAPNTSTSAAGNPPPPTP